MGPYSAERQTVIDQLTAPDGYFPVEMADVRGHQVPVLVNRKRSLRELVEASRAHGDAEFIVHGERRITHAAFPDFVAACSAALAEDHGITKGDRVAILAANSPDWLISYFALVSLGAIVCLSNGWWTPDEIRHATELTTPKLILGDEKRLARVPDDITTPQVDLDAARDRLQRDVGTHALPTVELQEDDACSIFFTSGTTGRAKGATVSHRGLVGFAEVQLLNGAVGAMIDAARDQAAGREPKPRGGPPRVLMTSPLFHVSGLSGAALINMNVGGALVFRENSRFDADECLALVEKERVTAWTLIGSMGPRVVEHPRLDDYDLSSLSTVGFGGAPASPELQAKVRRAFSSAESTVAIGYGSSETVGAVAGIRGADYEANPTSTGYINPTVSVQIRDESGRPAAEGGNGRIWVRSCTAMLGYWDNPEATAEVFDDDFWLDTGDVGRIEDGLLYIDSRARDMILHNAENVYPVEVEYRIDEHPDVIECAVYGLDDAATGQIVAASVVPRDDAAVTEEALRAWCAETLAPFKVPGRWDIRTEPLPRNAAGKVVKAALTGERDHQVHDD
ncbi:MAG: class I adenylate-forming enzyme family protein [Acidimicrobiales bacterium]|nr:class I adenylate-forming enzyme family protein [Acidimicrobiales bacterium]